MFHNKLPWHWNCSSLAIEQTTYSSFRTSFQHKTSKLLEFEFIGYKNNLVSQKKEVFNNVIWTNLTEKNQHKESESCIYSFGCLLTLCQPIEKVFHSLCSSIHLCVSDQRCRQVWGRGYLSPLPWDRTRCSRRSCRSHAFLNRLSGSNTRGLGNRSVKRKLEMINCAFHSGIKPILKYLSHDEKGFNEINIFNFVKWCEMITSVQAVCSTPL